MTAIMILILIVSLSFGLEGIANSIKGATSAIRDLTKAIKEKR